MVITRKDGTKLYPCCSYEENEHKIYNAHDRVMCELYKAQDSEDWDTVDEIYYQLDRIDRALNWVNCVYNGLIYAPYEDYQIIKEIVITYDLRAKGLMWCIVN